MTSTKEVDAQEILRLPNPVGTRIFTQPIGDWEGGYCVVTEVAPDPNAPNILFQVRRFSDGEEIGVLEWETVRIVSKKTE